MRTTIKLKKSCTVRNVLSPDQMFDIDLPPNTEVTHDRHSFDQGDVHVITYKDGGELYQAIKFVPRKDGARPGAGDSAPAPRADDLYSDDPERCSYDTDDCHADPFDKTADLHATYQQAQALPPVPATPAHGHLDAVAPLGDRELVLYRSKAGALGRYVVVRRFSRRQGNARTRLVVTLRAADFTGGVQFTVRADSVMPLAAHQTDAPHTGQSPDQPGNPFASEAPLNGSTDADGRPTFTLDAGQVNLTAGYLAHQGWPQTLECDVDGSGIKRRFVFGQLHVNGEDEVWGARYRNDQADLLIVSD